MFSSHFLEPLARLEMHPTGFVLLWSCLFFSISAGNPKFTTYAVQQIKTGNTRISPSGDDVSVKCPSDDTLFHGRGNCSKSVHDNQKLRGKRLFIPTTSNATHNQRHLDKDGLKIKDLGVLHDYKTSSTTEPSQLIHVFHTKTPNILIGKFVKSFTINGVVQRTFTLDATSDAEVVAVDSHSVPTQETTYLAIAQHETHPSASFRSVVLVYAITMRNAYSLFSRIQVKSLVTDVKVFSDNDGTLFLATTQRAVRCNEDFVSECGLSLIYRICVNGKAEVFSVAQLGNATHVEVVPHLNGHDFSMLVSKCGVPVQDLERCRMLHHVERSGRMPLSFFAQVSCNPKNAELFRFSDNLYYIGPDPKCQEQQISLWDYDMELAPLNIFPGEVEKWFVIDSPSRDCGCNLIIAAVGKEETVLYGLESPEKQWRKLFSHPDLPMDYLWSSGRHMYIVVRSADEITLLRLTCVRQNNKDRRDFDDVSDVASLPLEHVIGNKSLQGIVDDSHAVTLDEVNEPLYMVDGVSGQDHTTVSPSVYTETVAVLSGDRTRRLENAHLTDGPTTGAPAMESGSLSQLTSVADHSELSNPVAVSGDTKSLTSDSSPDDALNPEIESSGCHIDTVERKGHLNLYSPFSSIVEVKSGSVLVVPPTMEDPCYNLFEFSSHNDLGVLASSRSKFCDQVSRSVSPGTMMHSKSAAQSNAGNIYIVSSYGDVLEFASVIKDNAVFDIKRAKPGVNFTSLAIRVCEGFPTACAVVRNCRGAEPDGSTGCTADLRCYRMFKLTWLPVITINVSVDTTIHMETYLKSDQCMLITESSFKRSVVVRFYKMRSTLKELDMSEPLEVRMCADHALQTIAIQRSIWLTGAVPDLNGHCVHSLFELVLEPAGNKIIVANGSCSSVYLQKYRMLQWGDSDYSGLSATESHSLLFDAERLC
ncbi:uncharacterized protein LOC129591657 isoform X2 [Paramacrobiotus metropolitanus]|uniref:uncharacterized protein LOC129591657 isoform X2 n=1 Tax=Paramacrobiotus metropolitanus TaxID=2943436 RepID=UPI002445BA06|nr:uncharacterized protein LOC129591657 isoform X2 [Paramacrobiotus metropolitanus]